MSKHESIRWFPNEKLSKREEKVWERADASSFTKSGERA